MPKNTEQSPNSKISRRTVLRGAGVAMALPWMESLAVAAATNNAPTAFPKRFGVVFMGNGINENHWSAEGAGADMKLSKTLSVLEPCKRRSKNRPQGGGLKGPEGAGKLDR